MFTLLARHSFKVPWETFLNAIDTVKDADATGGSLVEVVVGVVRANEREACAGGGSGGGSGAGKQEKEEAHECVWSAHGRRVADCEVTVRWDGCF